MSFLDDLTQKAQQEIGGATGGNTGGLEQVMGLINSPEIGGVSGLVGKFRQNGLGSVVDSWVGNGENQQIAAEHIEQALGPDKVAALASKMGMSPDDAKAKLAALLPQVVSHLTPNGNLPHA
jgi:uncharacterized protein YidB (DUF937 family)